MNHRLWAVVLGIVLMLLLLGIVVVMAQKPALRDNPNDPVSAGGNPGSPSVAARTAHTYTTAVAATITTVTTDPNPNDSDGQAAATVVGPSICKALVIVSGRMKEDDPLQDNIHSVTNAVYDLVRTYGYPSEQIFYLATDSTLDADGDGQPDVDAPPSDANLSYAITQWAVDAVGPDRCLTLYLMGHGGTERFYLDNTVGEILTPEELDGWLDELEAAVPGLETNVVMDSAYAGSFIDSPQSVSGPKRVIIASTSNTGLAYASQDGAIFSDAFIAALAPDVNLQTAFEEACNVVEEAHPDQTPWLDDDGDGVANEAHDGQVASQRYLLSTGASSVAISGPTTGIFHVGYAFTATVDPITATLPITYVWQATEQTPLMHEGGVSHTATFSWTVAGVKIITVTANNRWAPVSDTHVMTISTLANQAPSTPSDPIPADGARDVLTDQVLRWRGSDPDGDPVTWTVALGTSDPPPVVATDVLTTSFDPGRLITTTTYYWSVSASDGLSETAGPVWSFTTVIAEMGYEPNDTCGDAKLIPTDGTVQVHSFHDEADEDWVYFQATAGITYAIEARTPPTSPADVVIEIYDSCDPGGSFDDSDPTFSPDIRLSFEAPSSGAYYLRLFNSNPAIFGDDVVYHLSVRALQGTQSSGAVIIVAGRLRSGDHLQDNIHQVTDHVYTFARDHGCTEDQVQYLATDTTRDGVTGLPTVANLEDAITNWAKDKVGPSDPLTLYLMDHGVYDLLYLDKPNGQWITPLDLDGWLDQLETSVPGVPINVVLEACYSGSFIDPYKSVSAPGRVVIASTSNEAVAYASDQGAAFSDSFLNSLGMGQSMYTAFEEGLWAAASGHSDQRAWLDDDGDGVANETDEDGNVAALRSLACEVFAPEENWAPHIAQLEVREFDPDSGVGEIWVRALDDQQVQLVWVVIYPPSYQELQQGEEMIPEPTPLSLVPQSDGWCSSLYVGFTEVGEYRLVAYAQDNELRRSRPKELALRTGWECEVYLPSVLRTD